MEYPMGGNSKLCGTCDYWLGSRQPNFYGTHVVLASQCVNGKCGCLSGIRARMDTFSNTTACNCYKKWAALK